MTDDFDTGPIRERYEERKRRQLLNWNNRAAYADPDYTGWTVPNYRQIAIDQALDQRSQYEWFCRLEVGA